MSARLAVLLAGATFAGLAAAQEFPVKPLRIIVEVAKWAKVVRASGAKAD